MAKKFSSMDLFNIPKHGNIIMAQREYWDRISKKEKEKYREGLYNALNGVMDKKLIEKLLTEPTLEENVFSEKEWKEINAKYHKSNRAKKIVLIQEEKKQKNGNFNREVFNVDRKYFNEFFKANRRYFVKKANEIDCSLQKLKKISMIIRFEPKDEKVKHYYGICYVGGLEKDFNIIITNIINKKCRYMETR